MGGSAMQGPLGAFKARFHSESQEVIARVSNVRWQLEILQKRCGDILPSSDAASFQAAIQPILQSLDSAKGLLLDADNKADGITVVNREETTNERY